MMGRRMGIVGKVKRSRPTALECVNACWECVNIVCHFLANNLSCIYLFCLFLKVEVHFLPASHSQRDALYQVLVVVRCGRQEEEEGFDCVSFYLNRRLVVPFPPSRFSIIDLHKRPVLSHSDSGRIDSWRSFMATKNQHDFFLEPRTTMYESTTYNLDCVIRKRPSCSSAR